MGLGTYEHSKRAIFAQIFGKDLNFVRYSLSFIYRRLVSLMSMYVFNCLLAMWQNGKLSIIWKSPTQELVTSYTHTLRTSEYFTIPVTLMVWVQSVQRRD
jgi:hypothetical protein